MFCVCVDTAVNNVSGILSDDLSETMSNESRECNNWRKERKIAVISAFYLNKQPAIK